MEQVQIRERFTRWIEDTKELFALLPELLDHDQQLTAKSDHAEQETERLRRELTELRKELAAQVQRMLADRRADSFVTNFAGQWLFLRVEALFNHAFGEANNPLYYLGAITYFLFWIVIASGLYLFARERRRA